MSRLMAILTFACLALSAADPARETGPEPGSDDFEAILSLALAAPPALGSEAVLRLLERSEGLQASEEVLDTLERAAVLSGAITEQFPTIYVATGNAGSQEFLRATLKLRRGIDRLSILARLAEVMSGLDRERAIELADEAILSRLVTISSPTCVDRSIPDFSRLTRMVQRIIRASAAPDQVEIDEHLRLAQALLTNASYSIELPALAGLLVESPFSRSELELLAAQFSDSLRSVHDGDPSFSLALDGMSLPSMVIQLTKRLRSVDLDPTSVVRAYRHYLVRNSGGSRCANSLALHRALGGQSQQSDWMAAFNYSLGKGRVYDGLGIPAIKPEEMEPDTVAQEAPPPFRPVSEPHARLRSEAMTSIVENAAYGKDSPEWREAVDRLLEKTRSWDADRREEREGHFVEKCDIYRLLAMSSQNSAKIDDVAGAFVGFMSNHDLASEQPALWLGCLDSILSIDDEKEEDPAIGTARSAIIAAARKSRDSALLAFASLAMVDSQFSQNSAEPKLQ